MKKTFCILLALCTVCAIGCTQSDSTPADSTPADPVEYTIYCGGSDLAFLIEQENSADRADSADQPTVSRQVLPHDCDFTFMADTTDENPNAPRQKEFTVAGKTYTLQFHSSRVSSLADSEVPALRAYGTTDRYVSTKCILNLDQATGKLRFFSDHAIDRFASGSFTNADAVAASAAILTEQFGTECLDYYTDQPSVSKSTTEYSGTVIVVTYRKSVEGYPTNDCLQLRFSPRGQLVCINANNYGIMQSALNQYSAEQLQAAERYLTDYLDSIPCSYDRDSIKLMTNSNGKCYFEIVAVCDFNDAIGSHLMEFYVNVE